MAPVLEIENLSTHIKLTSSVVQAVGNVDMQIDAGETLGVVGESGCGKSMTGLSIMGLLPPGGSIVGGSIKLDGRELVGLKQEELRQVRGNEIAMIFQDPLTSLDPTKTIGYQVAEPVRLHRGTTKAEALDRAVEVLNLVGPAPAEGAARRLPAPAVRRPAAARDDRHGAGLRAQAAHRRRADHGARRHHPGADPRPAQGPEGAAGHGHAADHARHGRDRRARRPGQRDVRGPGGGDRRGAPALQTRCTIPTPRPCSPRSRSSTRTPDKALHAIPGLPPDLAHPPQGCRFAARCPRATDKCRTEEPSLAGKTFEHRFSCWHPVDGPLALAVIGEGGPDAASTGLVASDAESMDEAAADDEVGLVADAPLPGASETAPGTQEPAQEPTESEPLVVVAAGLEVTADGRLEVTERTVEVAAANGDGVPPLLELRNLVKEFPITSGAILQRKVASVHAVSDVSFAVPAGTTFGLVGESGCGKTTIGKLIVALEKPNSGAITLNGEDVSKLRGGDLRRKRRDLQLMFQDPQSSLDPRMRVGTIIGEPLAVQHLGSKRAQRDRVFELLSEVGLPRNAVERYPHEFSGGQRQRIGLARALTVNPRLIVADEPVSALDVSIRAQVLNLMKRLQASHGLTYVVISHDLAVVKYMADRIGVMYLGKLVELGSGQDIYERAAHPYTAGLIATIPVPNPTLERAKTGAAIRGELPSPVNPPSGCRFRTRCQFAQERCAAEEPPLRSFGPGHLAACHFPLQTPDGATVGTSVMTAAGLSGGPPSP